MLDVRNRDLAEATRADDFVVSDKLIALLLSHPEKSIPVTFAEGDRVIMLAES